MTVTVDLVQLTKIYKNATEPSVDAIDMNIEQGPAGGHARSLGLRQDDDHEDGRRPARPHQRGRAVRRRVGRRHPGREAPGGDGLPEAAALPAHVHRRQRGLRAAHARRRQEDAQEAGRRDDGAGAPARHGGPPSRVSSRAARSSASRSRAALITEPDILLLDEPLSQLDANLRIEMRDLIRSIQAELGITSIFVTHDQEEAVMLADRIALMLQGRIQQDGLPQDFYERPVTQAVARFFGTQNFVPGTVSGRALRVGPGHARAGPRPPRRRGPAGHPPGGHRGRRRREQLRGHRRARHVPGHASCASGPCRGRRRCSSPHRPACATSADQTITLRLPKEQTWVVPAEDKHPVIPKLLNADWNYWPEGHSAEVDLDLQREARLRRHRAGRLRRRRPAFRGQGGRRTVRWPTSTACPWARCSTRCRRPVGRTAAWATRDTRPRPSSGRWRRRGSARDAFGCSVLGLWPGADTLDRTTRPAEVWPMMVELLPGHRRAGGRAGHGGGRRVQAPRDAGQCRRRAAALRCGGPPGARRAARHRPCAVGGRGPAGGAAPRRRPAQARAPGRHARAGRGRPAAGLASRLHRLHGRPSTRSATPAPCHWTCTAAWRTAWSAARRPAAYGYDDHEGSDRTGAGQR